MWLTESIRLTAFADSPNVDLGVNWWREVVGQEPASHTVQRVMPSLQDHGPIYNGYCNLSLTYQPGRIDWVMSAIIPETLKFESFPNFGPLDEAVSRFRGIALTWLKSAPPLKRLAVGAVVLMPVADKSDGYQKIQRFLPSVKIDENSADFSYQINRPRESRTIGSLRINRLSRWSVAMLSGIQFQIGPGGSSQAIESPSGISAIRLDLDINTQPENVQPIAPEARAPLFEELTAFAREIADKGDTP